MKFYRSFTFAFVTSLFLLSSCSDLGVDNQNAPDTKDLLSSERELLVLSNNLFRDWYTTVHGYQKLPAALTISADVTTSSWGNNAMRDLGQEPRTPWNNSTSYAYAKVTLDLYNKLYEINAKATNTMTQISTSAVDIDDEARLQLTAQSKFIQALTLGYIALIFDKGYIIDEHTTQDELIRPPLFNSSLIMDHAVIRLEEVIELAESNAFNLQDGFIPTGFTIDQDYLAQLSHSFIARFMVNIPRNEVQQEFIDWDLVEQHVKAGLSSDFEVIMDDQTIWNDALWINAYPGWARTDMRIIAMMYPNGPYPVRMQGEEYPEPDSITVFASPEIDNRLITYFQHLPGNYMLCFRPPCLNTESQFRFKRNDEYLALWNTPVRELTTSEMEMILAEALLHQNKPGEAAAVINNNYERSFVGGLPPVSANYQEIVDAIHQEVVVEQQPTGMGNEFFFMRRYNLLQEGTPLHFPIPAQVLLNTNQANYTFGGVDNADGINTSNGGWD